MKRYKVEDNSSTYGYIENGVWYKNKWIVINQTGNHFVSTITLANPNGPERVEAKFVVDYEKKELIREPGGVILKLREVEAI